MATMRTCGSRCAARRRPATWAASAPGVQAEGIEALRERVAVLEDEVQECRQLNLRLAELTDVVQELLLPVAAAGRAAHRRGLEKYSQGL